MTLRRLALARSTLDRAAHRRADPGLLGALWAANTTAVLLVDGDRAPVIETVSGASLAVLAPRVAEEWIRTEWPTARSSSGQGPAEACYLGESLGREYLAVSRPGGRPPTAPGPGTSAEPEPSGPLPPGADRWAGLREVGALLDDTGAGLLTTAVALGRWHAVHPHCARCGARTEQGQAGWLRVCPGCSAEHYPRTDGAVIMTVVDSADRLLLGRQARWPQNRFSCLAGFVEPGESLEAAVAREVFEESGVVVDEIDYLASQPWPFPASLMLGFRARAVSTTITVDGVEVTEARWWTREQFDADVATGELVLPPEVSIARRLVEHWYGEPIKDDGAAWL